MLARLLAGLRFVVILCPGLSASSADEDSLDQAPPKRLTLRGPLSPGLTEAVKRGRRRAAELDWAGSFPALRLRIGWSASRHLSSPIGKTRVEDVVGLTIFSPGKCLEQLACYFIDRPSRYSQQTSYSNSVPIRTSSRCQVRSWVCYFRWHMFMGRCKTTI